MTHVMRTRLLASTLLAGVAAVATPAFAQTAPASTNPPTADAGSPAAGVQTTDSAPNTAAGDTGAIIVTGSLIRNPNLKAAAPVQVVGREEMQLRQTNVAEEILRDLPGAVAGIGSAVNNGNGGASTVNLRGLDSKRNLVLLDGQRIVPYSLGGVVDLNNIPLALVERVDTLTGGAATTYGADAVAGVVNFITRHDFSGIEINSSEQITQRGDGNTFRTDLTIGGNFDDGKGNAVLSIGYQKADPVYQGDRPFSVFSRDSHSGNNSGSGTTTPSTFNLPGTGTVQVSRDGNSLVPLYSLFNFNPYNIFQTPFKRFNIFGEAHYDISDKLTVYSRAMFSKNTVSTILAAGGLFGAQLSVNYNNPFLPAGIAQQFCNANGLTAAQCTAARTATGPSDPNYRTFTSPSVSRRTTEFGTRDSNNTTTIFDFKAGAKYTFSDHLALDIGGNYGQSELVSIGTGNIVSSRIRQSALSSNGITCDGAADANCVPVNLFGQPGSLTQAMAQYLTVDTNTTIKTSLKQAHAVLNGDFGVTSPWAKDPISFAVGAEYREYFASQLGDPISATPGEISGSGGAVVPIAGGYQVLEGYAEVIAPLVADKPFFHSLQAEGGFRYSHYKVDTAGSPTFNTKTYKGALTWEPVDGFKLRGNYQRAVRAPNIGELFTPVSVGLTNLSGDPCASLKADGVTRFQAPPSGNLRAVCLAQGASLAAVDLIHDDPAGQVNFYGGGNTNLKPEVSDSFTVGVVLQPQQIIPGLSITVDYYKIKIKDAITLPTPGDALSACFGNITAASATDPACLAIKRNPGTGYLFGDPAVTPGLPLSLSNLGRIKTDGIDLSANYRRDLGFAKLNMSFNGNWTHSNKFQATPTSINRECVGYYSVNCSLTGSLLPEFSWNLRTSLTRGPFTASVLWRYISSMKQEPQDVIDNGPAFPAFQRIPAANYFDLTLQTVVNSNLDLTLTVQNLANKRPPIVGSTIGSTAYDSGNTYPSTYDALGRRFAVGARVKF